MPSSATATVTGKIGPGNTLTAVVYSNINQYTFDPVNNLFIYRSNQNNKVNQVDISAATTITITLSAAAGNHTVTIS